jgi:PEGA domain-containing protein
MKSFRLKVILLISIMASVFLFFDSTAASQGGQLVVDSAPAGARVLINGEFYGHTPMRVRLYPEEYRLRLEKEGYNPYRTRIRIPKRKRLKIFANLEHRNLFGMLMVRSHPPKAKIYVDDQYYGETPERIKLKQGRHIIRLEKDRYKPYYESIDIRRSQKTNINADLKPFQRFGTIAITSHPDGARVMINNEYYNRTPMKTKLRSGVYTVKLNKRGYKPLVREVRVRRGQVTSGDFELEKIRPRPRKGWLKIYSFPENARVVIQDREHGRTPVEVQLPEGNYFVQIKKKGFLPYEKDVHVERREVSYINADLEKKRGRHKFGEIHFSTNPRRAKVSIDGNYRGETPLSVRIPAGVHQVKIRMRGYEPFHQSVHVKPWGDHYVEADLVAVAPPMTSTGTLKIVSKPLRSKVFINKIYKGKTPLEITLNPNMYVLEVRHKSHLTYRQPVHIKPGQVANIRARLIWAGHIPPPPHKVIEKLTRKLFK